MKTTEIFIEQVIIGSIILLISYLFLHQDLHDYIIGFCESKVFTQISLGIILVGVAYLIGIVYDRFADSMFQDIERLCRLNYALKDIKSFSELENDPFRESDYRMKLLTSGLAISREDYLRTRLRLLRSMATLLPAIAAALCFFVSKCIQPEVGYICLIVFIIVNLSIFLRKILREKDKAPPKTNNEKHLIAYIKDRKLLKPNSNNNNLELDLKAILYLVIKDWIIWLPLITLILLVCFLLALEFKIIIIFIVLVGLLVTFITIWSWWRIYLTYFSFIKKFYFSNYVNKAGK